MRCRTVRPSLDAAICTSTVRGTDVSSRFRSLPYSDRAMNIFARSKADQVKRRRTRSGYKSKGTRDRQGCSVEEEFALYEVVT